MIDGTAIVFGQPDATLFNSEPAQVIPEHDFAIERAPSEHPYVAVFHVRHSGDYWPEI
jgi:hypothetical protein